MKMKMNNLDLFIHKFPTAPIQLHYAIHLIDIRIINDDGKFVVSYAQQSKIACQHTWDSSDVSTSSIFKSKIYFRV